MAIEESEEDFKLNAAAEKDVYFRCERKEWSPYQLPPPQTTFWAVRQAQEKICNGGFQYFFENDWLEKPTYGIFIEAYLRTGATEAADYLTKAVAQFPFPAPHLHYQKRREYMDLCTTRDGEYHTIFDHLGKQMMDLTDENYTKLAAWVRANIDAFPTAKAFLKQK